VQLRILTFASATEQIGLRETEMECAPVDTPRQILARLCPSFDSDSARVALDCEYVAWDAPIGDARELAVLPPVSGG
jgi:molybdopterin synthase sulfur carrier subunit